MSKLDAIEPACTARTDAVQLLIESKSRDLGGFSVRRVLPATEQRKVGPFVFFDEMGPATFPPGKGINVRPHPHIGLSTVTFLFHGEILHRDSLGYVQPIQPGAVNLMTAGAGIVHSERTSHEMLESGQKLHGIQVWMALPDDMQEIDPTFKHYPRDQLPIVTEDGLATTVIIGQHAGHVSPVSVEAETLYLEQKLRAGSNASYAICEELAVYVVHGDIRVGACQVHAGQMAVFDTSTPPRVTASQDSHIMILGGEAMSERHQFWNFVHRSSTRIEAAKQDWREGRFDGVPGDDEFIPLPE